MNPRTLLLVLIVTVSGCAQPFPILQAEGAMHQFFAASPTREQVILKFGAPSEHFENERILTYLLLPDEKGDWRPVSRQHGFGDKWVGVTHNLVVVFKPDGKLEKYALIRTAAAEP